MDEKNVFSMKKVFLCAAVCVIAVIVVFNYINKSDVDSSTIKIGVSIYKTNDTFVADMVNALEQSAKEYEREKGIKVMLDISSAKESQRTQNEQIKRYISLNYDVICVNTVDRTYASTIIDMADGAGIPVVFFNREPVDEDIFKDENIYYVGTDAQGTALHQVEILIDAYNSDPESIDKNGDGKLQYVMLEGEMGHQDAIIRTEWSVARLISSGIAMEKLQSGTANWERSQASAFMEQWIKAYGDSIEVVMCNNDDMALGAADALEKEGMENVAVLGIDATEPGIEAVKDGRLLGTVDCGAEQQGEAIFKLAAGLALTGRPPEDIELVNNRYFRAELTKITR